MADPTAEHLTEEAELPVVVEQFESREEVTVGA
jgi:hypothetical protein